MKAQLSGESFNRIIAAVKDFTSKNSRNTNNSMIQLHFIKDDVKVTAYALDGYKAAKEAVNCLYVEEDFTVLVSPPPIKASREASVEISTDGEYTYINYGDITFRTKNPAGELFDVEKAISAEVNRGGKQKIGINADYLIAALKSLKASGVCFRKPVIIEFGSPLEPILLRTDSDNYKMVLPVRLRGE